MSGEATRRWRIQFNYGFQLHVTRLNIDHPATNDSEVREFRLLGGD